MEPSATGQLSGIPSIIESQVSRTETEHSGAKKEKKSRKRRGKTQMYVVVSCEYTVYTQWFIAFASLSCLRVFNQPCYIDII